MERAYKDSPNTRIKCVVDSCEFWDTGNQCVASVIEVQPPHASDTQETDCTTFQPKEGYEMNMNVAEAIKGVSGRAQNLDANMGVVDQIELQ